PHVTDEIKRRIRQCAEGFDMVLVEVGGTVGDYENEIFLYALKSIERDIGEENMVYVLVTYLPILRHLGEMKTKPTQQAIRLLGENGIFPDFILCRGTQPLDDIRKKKIEVSANIGADCIISNPDVQTLYSIPLDLEAEGMGKKLLDKLGLKPKQSPDWTHWKKLVHTIEHPRKTVKIAMVGKYVESGDFSFSDSYVSINQSLEHAGAALGVRVAISWIDAKRFEQDASKVGELDEYDGILIPGAFGGTGAEGMLSAVKYAREHHVPYLGLCYGLHMAVVEFARNVCGMEGGNSSEIDPKTKYPVIDFQPEQRERIKRKEYGGSMRLGAYSAILKTGSQVLKLYKKSGRLKEDARRIAELKKDPENASHLGLLPPEGNVVLERHRHRYEVAPEFVETLERKGLVFSGYHLTKRGSKLMEFLELPGHPYFIATQAHPEFKSRLEKPAPLFHGFIEAA
ncbi:MAG: CTP synthase, partial [Candidatus Latescibacteria bacterium]|nr:CTP synthase [Candidatus Latescibacterota bacterium]